MGVRWGSCMWCACEGEVIHHGETSEETRRTAGKVNVSPAMSEARIYFTFKSQPTMPSGLTATSFPPWHAGRWHPWAEPHSQCKGQIRQLNYSISQVTLTLYCRSWIAIKKARLIPPFWQTVVCQLWTLFCLVTTISASRFCTSELFVLNRWTRWWIKITVCTFFLYLKRP